MPRGGAAGFPGRLGQLAHLLPVPGRRLLRRLLPWGYRRFALSLAGVAAGLTATVAGLAWGCPRLQPGEHGGVVVGAPLLLSLGGAVLALGAGLSLATVLKAWCDEARWELERGGYVPPRNR